MNQNKILYCISCENLKKKDLTIVTEVLEECIHDEDILKFKTMTLGHLALLNFKEKTSFSSVDGDFVSDSIITDALDSRCLEKMFRIISCSLSSVNYDSTIVKTTFFIPRDIKQIDEII